MSICKNLGSGFVQAIAPNVVAKSVKCMKTKLILTEKDIKRAIEEYLVSTNQGKATSIRLEQGNNDVSPDPREYSAFYAEVELDVEGDGIESVELN
ncbi:MAG: hypothetical protein KME45_27590 [Stenomitos rutilans HA7619-LM2]|jgi:hypothetical protein|nr:hypothetical protein [Stenomitos rutilans HA7619-LM2]